MQFLDYVQQRLYWVDAKLHSIASCNLEGGDLKNIYKDHSVLGHPFGITVFEDYLFWTDWMSNAVHRVNKFGKETASIIALNLKSPMGIHVYHISRQPKGRAFCWMVCYLHYQCFLDKQFYNKIAFYFYFCIACLSLKNCF